MGETLIVADELAESRAAGRPDRRVGAADRLQPRRRGLCPSAARSRRGRGRVGLRRADAPGRACHGRCGHGLRPYRAQPRRRRLPARPQARAADDLQRAGGRGVSRRSAVLRRQGHRAPQRQGGERQRRGDRQAVGGGTAGGARQAHPFLSRIPGAPRRRSSTATRRNGSPPSTSRWATGRTSTARRSASAR